MGSGLSDDSVTPAVSWTEADPLDVISALNSLRNLHEGLWTVSETVGGSVDTYLRWARAAIDAADAATSEDLRRRHSVEAVGHSKRALDRLFDEFLRRDWLQLQLNARPSFAERLHLLRRRLGNRVPWRLIPSVVAEPRNDAEHEYLTPSVDEAGRAVEAAEVVAHAMRIHHLHPPLLRPTLLGRVATRFSSAEPTRATFHGFDHRTRGLAVCVEGRDGVVRLGCGRVLDHATVDMTWCRLDAVSSDGHLGILAWWDAQCSKVWIEEPGARQVMAAAGLDGPA